MSVSSQPRLADYLRTPEILSKFALHYQTGKPMPQALVDKIKKGSPSRNGTVTVDVALDEALPRGARPDMSVDGTIELERLDNILYVGRPAFGQEQGRTSLFRLTPDRSMATLTPVELGRSSVNTIEIVAGLKPGDQVILSDMSAWDAFERIRLN